MQQNYSKKIEPIQKATKNTASSVLDASSQSEALQRKADMANNAAQREEAPRPNNTGMPDNLKSGIESLSGFSMDDVRVHYNSSKPATVQALAYTQGTDIHVAPGQEKHLPHEAWHVAQQMAGRVSPTTIINGMPVNDNAALEHEADVMGEKAVQRKGMECSTTLQKRNCDHIVQCKTLYEIFQAFNVNASVISKITELCDKNPALAKWVSDALDACQHVNRIEEGDFKGVGNVIYGKDEAHYPGKESNVPGFSDEMKIITILHELMHIAVRNGAYKKENIDKKTFDFNSSRHSDVGGKDNISDEDDWNISADGNADAQQQRLTLCKNIFYLRDIFEKEVRSERFNYEEATYLNRRIMHIYDCPLVEYDAVLGDLVYYMMRMRLSNTNTYRHALKMLEDANERRHAPTKKAKEIAP